MLKNVFILGLIFILTLTFNIINNTQTTFQAVFQNVDGLPKGAPVTALGVRIGKVIRTKPTKDGVLVTIKITKKGFTTPEHGSRLTITSFRPGQGRVIEVLPPSAKDLDESRSILVQEPITNESWLHASLEILDGIEQSSKTVIKHVTPENFDKTRASLRSASESLSRFAEKFSIYQEDLTKLKQKVSERAKEGHEIVTRANKALSTINTNLKMDNKHLNKTLKQLRDELNLIASNVNTPDFAEKLQGWKLHLNEYLNEVNISLIEDGKKIDNPIYKEKYFEFKKGVDSLSVGIDNFNRKKLLDLKVKTKEAREIVEKASELIK